jgi:hypothetical protein
MSRQIAAQRHETGGIFFIAQICNFFIKSKKMQISEIFVFIFSILNEQVLLSHFTLFINSNGGVIQDGD